LTAENSTIAAVATPLGAGAIAIVRLSGPRAEEILRRLFRPAKTNFPLKSHRLHLGRLVDPQTGRLVDQVLCTFMKAPATYTREDIVEIHCHGGPVAARRILELVLHYGAELAAPGEFTRRAFLAGRIDLTQAEAVAELVGARSAAEAQLAAAQLAGGLRDRVEALRRPLLEILAHLEVAIDFPDEEAEIIAPDQAAERLDREVLAPLDRLLAAYDSGRVFREGLKAAIVGRPNVGKSSLLNALLKTDRAIVTPVPGTTRDLIEAEAVLSGLPMTLIDTAGLETPPADEIEAEGQRRAAARLAAADLVLLVLDRSRPLTDEDRRLFAAAPAGRTLLVLNKIDLPAAFTLDQAADFLGGGPAVEISALTGQGLDRLQEEIFKTACGGPASPDQVPDLVPNLRHKKALEAARPALARAVEGLKNGLAPELAALEINLALEALGGLIGLTTPDDVLEEIFSRFCLGK